MTSVAEKVISVDTWTVRHANISIEPEGAVLVENKYAIQAFVYGVSFQQIVDGSEHEPTGKAYGFGVKYDGTPSKRNARLYSLRLTDLPGDLRYLVERALWGER